ncbi:MAG: radical SAM protein [Chloroflexota bacterium]
MSRGRASRKVSLRPREHLAREQGAVSKDWGGRLPVALVYPNRYYLGMSNLGIHAIYRLLNDHPRIVCERVFLEEGWEGQPPRSLESGRPLADFAVVAFSVSYELDYFHVASLLKDSGLPLYSRQRQPGHPLVIAGGPCITANPMPLAPFFDCLCPGEAEAILPAMLTLLLESGGHRQEDLLDALSALPGCYVPERFTGGRITRQWLPDLDAFPTHTTILSPDTELGDLYLIEAERGCPRGCRFCLVNTTFQPARFRSRERLVAQAREGLRFRRRIGLVGPAVADHPEIPGLLEDLLDMNAEISVSSLRIGSRSRRIIPLLARGGARTVTLAPEAGSLRLRRSIKKNIAEEEILETIAAATAEGIEQIKLYFMLGLPGETEEDVQATVALMTAVRGVVLRQKSGTRLAMNIAPFVPKAGTPFQWLPVTPTPLLNRRLAQLQRSLAPLGIQLKHESPAWSQVQGILSRGGTDVTPILAEMPEISLSGWKRAVARHGLDVDFYARAWGTDQHLPWDFIDLGTPPEKLAEELCAAQS